MNPDADQPGSESTPASSHVEVRALRLRIQSLEERLASLEARMPRSPSAAAPNGSWPGAPERNIAAPPLPQAPTPPASQSNPTAATPVQNSGQVSHQESFLGATVLPWVGAGVVATGVIALVSYAIAIGFFTPPIQFAGSLLLAAGFLGAGIRTSEKSPDFADILKGLSALCAFLAFGAGHLTWKLYDASTAIGALFAVGMACYLYSDRTSKIGFAVLGFAGSTCTAYLASTGENQGVGAIVGLLSLVLTSAVAARNRWSPLAACGYAASVVILGLSVHTGDADKSRLPVPAHLLYLLALFVIPLAAHLMAQRAPAPAGDPAAQPVARHEDSLRNARTLAVALFGFAHYFAVLWFGPQMPGAEEWYNTPLAGAFALLVALAALAVRFSPASHLVHGTWLAIGFGLFLAPYTAETEIRLGYFSALAVIVPALALVLRPDNQVARNAFGTVNLAAGFFAGLHYSYFLLKPPFPFPEPIAWCALFLGVLLSMCLVHQTGGGKSLSTTNTVNAIAGAVLLIRAASDLVPPLADVPWHTTPLTLLLAMWSAALLIAGFPLRDSSMREMGATGLFLISAKIIFYDLAQVPPVPRIAVSMVVGLGLIILSYFLYIRPAKSSPPSV